MRRCCTDRSCLPGLPARVGSCPSVAAHTAARRRHARCPAKGPSSAPRAAMSAFVHLSELPAASSSSNGVPQRAWRAAQTRRQRRCNSRAAGACLQPQQDGGHELRGSLERPCVVIRAGSQQRPRYLLYVPGARYGAALHQARDKQCPGSISLQKVTSWMLLSVPMRELLACSQPAIHRQDTCTELTCRQ